MLTVGNDRQFRSCCDAFGLPELGEDPRFATMSNRISNRESLIPLLQSKLLERDTSEWLALLLKQGVPAGPVNDIAEVLTNRHAVERQLVRQISRNDNTTVPTVSNPVEFSDTPVRYERVPPALGEHTDEVLREWLGYSEAKIELLRRNAVI